MVRQPRSPRSLHAPRYKEMLVRLRRARQDAGLTQVQVAERLGRTQAFVSKCELGERQIDPIELSDFAALYAMPVTHFIPSVKQK